MASEKQQAMLEVLADSLSEKAVDLSDEGSAEYAFPVVYARDVFDSLEQAGVRILGGDLWMSSEDGYASAHEGWYVASSSVPSSRRSEWEKFISRFPEAGHYYVTFVV